MIAQSAISNSTKHLTQLDAANTPKELTDAELDQVAGGGISKMMSTLSNLLKKISDTAQSITQNLK